MDSIIAITAPMLNGIYNGDIFIVANRAAAGVALDATGSIVSSTTS